MASRQNLIPGNAKTDENEDERREAAKRYLEEVRKDISVGGAATKTKTSQQKPTRTSEGKEATTSSGATATQATTSSSSQHPFFRKLDLPGTDDEDIAKETPTGRRSSSRGHYPTGRTFGADERLRTVSARYDKESLSGSEAGDEHDRKHTKDDGEQEEKKEERDKTEEGDDTFLTEAKIAGDEFDIKEGAFENLVAGVDQESQATLLLKKQQDLRIVDDALEYMKKEYRQRMKEVKEKEEKLLTDKSEMEAMVERFRDFIADNDAKRNRAEMKAQSESEARKKLETEVYDLQQQLSQLEQEQEALESRLNSLKRYSHYLEKCLSASKEDFHEPAGLLQRHATLKRTNESLNRHAQEIQKSAEERRQMVQNLLNETQNRVLALSSEYQDMQKKHEQLILERDDLEAQADSRENQDRRHTAVSGEVSRAIRNMYQRCYSTAYKKALLRVASDPDQEPISYLLECVDVIDWRLTDLIKLSEDYPAWKANKEREKTEKARGQAETQTPPSHPVKDQGRSGPIKYGRRAGSTLLGKTQTKKPQLDVRSEESQLSVGRESIESSTDLGNLATQKTMGTGEIASKRKGSNVFVVKLSNGTNRDPSRIGTSDLGTTGIENTFAGD